jgi:hypothetical protein
MDRHRIKEGALDGLRTEMQVDASQSSRSPHVAGFLSDALPFKLLGAATDETRLGEQVQKLISNNPCGQANARQRE